MICSFRNLYVSTAVLLFATLNIGDTSYAQTTLSDGRHVQGWVPISLTFAGQNLQDGVEAFCQLSKCNGEDVVLIKLSNHNTDAITVEWADAVFTKELKWVSKKNITN